MPRFPAMFRQGAGKLRACGGFCLGLLTGLSSGQASGGLDSPPPRPAGAPGGQAVAHAVSGLDLKQREEILLREILSGNVPDFWRKFAEVTVQAGGSRLVFLTAPDYLAVGSDADFFRTPLTPTVARVIAARFHCTLPTRKMADAIYHAAAVKLTPVPRPPGPDMTAVPAFLAYQETVRAQREATLAAFPLGSLVAGHQKDLVQTPRLAEDSGKVAIYGWHRPDGTPIQPLYTGHAETWVDYSHGIRLVSEAVFLNGRPSTIHHVLEDPRLAPLLSDEIMPAPDKSKDHGETLTELVPEPGVRIVVNRPARVDSAKPVRLVLYALPNGNTIEQTLGRHPAPGEDWHFGIQHIAAQTRWLRERHPENTLMVAYLECAGKSWPAWCRKHSDSGRRIAAMTAMLRRQFAGPSLKLVLTGHSGGGAFIFRWLDSQEAIPYDVERIAFLDSNYAYDSAKGHAAKLAAWLGGGTERYLTVVAYHDSIALLDGKTFVSEKGGTWGRSHAMLEDLGKTVAFRKTVDGLLQTHTALGGRITFLLRENPEKAVLHTRLVERNGFLQALLAGTPAENHGYQFFGEPVYHSLISGP